jgi:hypothetical protein
MRAPAAAYHHVTPCRFMPPPTLATVPFVAGAGSIVITARPRQRETFRKRDLKGLEWRSSSVETCCRTGGLGKRDGPARVQ